MSADDEADDQQDQNDDDTTDDDDQDDQDDNGDDDNDLQEQLNDANDTIERLKAMLGHYADDLDIEDELDFAVKARDGKYRYRPAGEAKETKTKNRRSRRNRRSTRNTPKEKSIEDMSEAEFDAYLEKARTKRS